MPKPVKKSFGAPRKSGANSSSKSSTSKSNSSKSRFNQAKKTPTRAQLQSQASLNANEATAPIISPRQALRQKMRDENAPHLLPRDNSPLARARAEAAKAAAKIGVANAKSTVEQGIEARDLAAKNAAENSAEREESERVNAGIADAQHEEAEGEENAVANFVASAENETEDGEIEYSNRASDAENDADEDGNDDSAANFGDDANSERLHKLIARAGVASRRAAEEIIAQGRVLVNGIVVIEAGVKANPFRDRISVDGQPLRVPTGPATVILMNKPSGVVSTRKDPEGRTTVTHLLPEKYKHLHPIGRLDYDTSGLLFLTDDGSLTQLLTHPSHGVEKVYWARVRGTVSVETVKRLEGGLYLEDGKTAPAKVRVRAQTENNALIQITIREGRNRQVRRMLDFVGHPVRALRRIRVAGFGVDELLPGQYRIMLPGEVHALRKAADTKAKSKPKTSDKRADFPARNASLNRNTPTNRGDFEGRNFVSNRNSSANSSAFGGRSSTRSSENTPRGVTPRNEFATERDRFSERSPSRAPERSPHRTPERERDNSSARDDFRTSPARANAQSRSASFRDSSARDSYSENSSRPRFDNTRLNSPSPRNNERSSDTRSFGARSSSDFVRPDSRPQASRPLAPNAERYGNANSSRNARPANNSRPANGERFSDSARVAREERKQHQKRAEQQQIHNSQAPRAEAHPLARRVAQNFADDRTQNRGARDAFSSSDSRSSAARPSDSRPLYATRPAAAPRSAFGARPVFGANSDAPRLGAARSADSSARDSRFGAANSPRFGAARDASDRSSSYGNTFSERSGMAPKSEFGGKGARQAKPTRPPKPARTFAATTAAAKAEALRNGTSSPSKFGRERSGDAPTNARGESRFGASRDNSTKPKPFGVKPFGAKPSGALSAKENKSIQARAAGAQTPSSSKPPARRGERPWGKKTRKRA